MDTLLRIPKGILMEILLKLDIETLSSVACVSTTLQVAVADAVSHLSTLHLPVDFAPDSQTLKAGILGRCRQCTGLTVNCRRLDDSSLVGFLGTHLLELHLLSCSLLSYDFLAAIGKNCPNLRVLVLELAAQDSPEIFNRNLAELLTRCLFLDSITLKIQGAEHIEADAFSAVEAFLPQTTRTLKLKSLLHQDAICIIDKLKDYGSSLITNYSRNFESPPLSPGLMLQCLSLTLDVISDELIIKLVDSLPFLVELHLKDMPNNKLLVHHDLTYLGFQSLSTCRNLTSLSLIRSNHNHQVSFKKLNDMGMFLLSEGCKRLESVRFCGFSKVSDAGFASIFLSCKRLKKIEIRNALQLSDLAFDGFDIVGGSITELRLLSCSRITFEFVKQLASTHLEVLDLYGCKSISDCCLDSLSSMHYLSSLILTATDITDDGLSVLGQGSSPIVRLSLRSCKRVTDDGIYHLFHHTGTLRKTLSALDLGNIEGITDRAIQTIASVGVGITELCIRSCFHVTDTSVEALAVKKQFQGDEGKLLRRLDLYGCIGLSISACSSFRGPLFPGLQWLGIGNTRLIDDGDVGLVEFCSKRPWLTLCLEGCEVGCIDGWQFHRS